MSPGDLLLNAWGKKDLQKKLSRNIQGRAMLSHSVVQLFCNPRDCSPPGSSVQGIFSQEYWSWLSFPTPGDLPDPGIKPASLASSSLAGRFLTIVLPRKANIQRGKQIIVRCLGRQIKTRIIDPVLHSPVRGLYPHTICHVAL